MLSADQVDMLGEMLNIAFARAAAPLAVLIGRYVELAAPEVSSLSRSMAVPWLQERFGPDSQVHVVQQAFHPTLAGEAVLVMRAEEKAYAWGLFADPGDVPTAEEEQDAALEVANLLVGACIGRLATLLGTEVRYTPPHLALFNQPLTDFEIASAPDLDLLVVHTRFSVEGTQFESGLFLVLQPEVKTWLAGALDQLIENYLLEEEQHEAIPEVEHSF